MPSYAIHGADVSAWGFADQADGGFMFMTLTGETGILDGWVRWANEQLQDCWTSSEPPRLTD